MNTWYQNLNKPPFTPPQVYFPIAWGILYTLMAISFVIILLKPSSKLKYTAIVLFIMQLGFNLLWTPLFFNLKQMTPALLDVLALFIFLVLTIIYFFKLSKFAAILLIPYLLQVIFAIYLNTGFILLN